LEGLSVAVEGLLTENTERGSEEICELDVTDPPLWPRATATMSTPTNDAMASNLRRQHSKTRLANLQFNECPGRNEGTCNHTTALSGGSSQYMARSLVALAALCSAPVSQPHAITISRIYKESPTASADVQD
jgi:hypothetical protein